MGAFSVFSTLAICLLLARQTFARNEAPCQKSKWNNGYNTFVSRHIRVDLPTTLNRDEWKAYIKNNGGCNRPTQSFLHPSDLDRVKSVCTSAGGRTHKENLCISRQPFTFFTVRSEPGTCGIRGVYEETKHLILACEVLENQCVPVHFEGNPEKLTPNNNARGCQDPDIKGHAPCFKMTWFPLLFVVLLVIFG